MRRLLLGLLCLAPATAHWSADDLPDWARRGRLQWSLCYSTLTREKVDLFAAGGQTLIHGGWWDQPATAAHAKELGLRWMPYVCSRTVTTGEIAKAPQLRDAVVLKPDGTEFLAYNNPVRRYGSLAQPAWPAFVDDRTRQVWDQPDAAAVFYDNVTVVDDYRPENTTAWQRWCATLQLPAGNRVPSLRGEPNSAAARAFCSDQLVRYYQHLRALCQSHQPPLLLSPNLGSLPGYGPAIVEGRGCDLVFYETESHPPFEHNHWRYKVGLACSHGQPTGVLAYLPEAVGAERGVKTWHEGMHAFFYPSSPLPEEFALGSAEAAACAGSYITNYDLFPSLPVTDPTDPFSRRVHRAVRQSTSFLTANAALYTQAQPGSDVAILQVSATETLDWRAQQLRQLCDALSAAGLPYEIVAAPDAATNHLEGVRTLIVPNAYACDEATAAGVEHFAAQGGRVILTGSFATTDPCGRAVDYAAVRALRGALRLWSKPVRDWQLKGFEPEGASHIRGHGGGQISEASLPFTGPAGRYVAHLRWQDENDGTSPFRLLVGNRTVFEGKLDHEDEQEHWFTSPPFDLQPGEVLTVWVKPDAGEMGRLHAVQLTAADAGQGAKLGRGQVTFCPDSLDVLPAAELAKLLAPPARLPQPGKVFVNLLAAPDDQLLGVHLVNFDFRYQVDHPERFANDAGRPTARTYFANPRTVVRKRLHVPHPERLTAPAITFFGYATPNTTAEFVITLNGQLAGRLKAGERSAWIELPIDRRLLREDNVIECRAEGALDMNHWWQISIDTTVPPGASEFSLDGGRTWDANDLSPDLRVQRGEYLIRIVDQQPDGADPDPANKAANPGFERTIVPHSETKLTVVPAQELTVEVRGDPRPALTLSPDAPPQWLTGQAHGGETTYTVPQVSIYTVLLLGDRARLERYRQATATAAPWAQPPVTEPLREQVTGWSAYGQGFQTEHRLTHSGKFAVTCTNERPDQRSAPMQQIVLNQQTPQPITLSAWSRAANVSGKPDQGYSVYVDAVCADGSAFNGHVAPFAVGTHDWEQATLKLQPTKPLRTMTLFLMFRQHTGQVWFDDVRVTSP